ncbi:hypothetical protein ACQCX2_15650 [Propionibacteriaceae bacterium Y1700]|uniref:hypothetical protein n=1 Tax=Microlunatus sp. Y1700 TaxID=3418487 RepID=UPI003DA78043
MTTMPTPGPTTEDPSLDLLVQAGEEIENARGLLTGLLQNMRDRLSGDLGLQYRYRLGARDQPGKQSSEALFKNWVGNVWHPAVGGPPPPLDPLRSQGDRYFVVSYVSEPQPEALEALKLVDATADKFDNLKSMNKDDINAIATLPRALGATNQALNAASIAANESRNAITALKNSLNNGPWESAGRELYRSLLDDQHVHYGLLHTSLHNAQQGNVALAQLALDLMKSFVSVFQANVELTKKIGDGVFAVVTCRDMLAIIQKLFDEAATMVIKHAQDVKDKLTALGNNAEWKTNINGAKSSVVTEWPQPKMSR